MSEKTDFIKKFYISLEKKTPLRLVLYDNRSESWTNINDYLSPKITEYMKKKTTEELDQIVDDIQSLFEWNQTLLFTYEIILFLISSFWNYFIIKTKEDSPTEKEVDFILSKINDWIKLKGFESPYKERRDIEKKLEEWDIWIIKERTRDEEIAKNFIESYKALEELGERKEITPIIYTFANLRIWLKTDPIMDKDRAIEIFNNSKVNPLIPYIQYNNKYSEHFFRLYKSPGVSFYEPQYEALVPTSFNTSLEKPNQFYLKVWMDEIDPEQSKKRATINSYEDALFSLKEKTIDVSTILKEKRNEKTTVNAIMSSLPNLVVRDVEERSIGAEFEIKNIKTFDPNVFVFLVTNDEVVSRFIAFQEINTIYADKKQLKFSFLSINPTMTNENKNENSFVLYPKENNIHVSISNVPSRDILDQLSTLLSKILSYYESRVDLVKQIISSFPPFFEKKEIGKKGKKEESDDEEEIEEEEEEEKKDKKKGKIIKPGKGLNKKLRRLAPDVFVSGSATRCQAGHQVDIIEDSEVEEWEKKTFQYEGKTYHRLVMRYPFIDENMDSSESSKIKQYNFVCDYDDYPFPTIVSKNSPPKPMVPCCGHSIHSLFMKKQMKEKKKLPIGATRDLSSDMVAQPDRYGALPFLMEKTLSTLYPNKEYNWFRLGMPRDENSFIHCLLTIFNSVYQKKRKVEEREKYVRLFREGLAENVNVSLVKQELFELEDQYIRKYIGDNQQFFDPRYTYRSLEEEFDINIFVFDSESLDLPYHAFHHIRPLRAERETVLIYRHTSKMENYPQCELILLKHEEKKDNTIMKFESKQIYEFFETIYRVYTWSIERNPETNRMETAGRLNFYQKLLFSDYFTLEKQYIDPYGKCYGFLAKIKDKHIEEKEEEEENKEEEELFSIFTPLCQPEDIPHIPLGTPLIKTLSIEKAMDYFGIPNSSYKNSHYQGLWFELFDMENAIFIPIDNGETISRNDGPIPYVQLTIGESPFFITSLKREANIFLQLLRWLYDLSSLIDPIEFAKKYIIINEEEECKDKRGGYNFVPLRNSSQVLPEKIHTVERGIVYLSQIVPTLFRGNKILLDSREMYDKVLLTIYRWKNEGAFFPINEEDSFKEEMENKYLLRDIFVSADDFKHTMTEEILIGNIALRNFLEQQAKKNEKGIFINTFVESLNAAILRTLQEKIYFHYTKTNQMYMLQPVIAGEIKRALYVAQKWLEEQINMGFQFTDSLDFLDEKKISYIVYDVTMDVIEDNRENMDSEDKYLELIQTDPNRYLALLPLL